MTKIKVVSVNISKQKGTVKTPVSEIIINKKGVKDDAHSGLWNRQLSMLGLESVQKFETKAGRKVNFGEFAENITTEGFLLYSANPLDCFKGENIELEVTQIGKKCHGDNCAIFREVGNCVMPLEGIFCRVLKGGKVRAGDILTYEPKVNRVMIITLSDRASRGEYEDKSGARLKERLENFFSETNRKAEIESTVIADQSELLDNILSVAKKEKYDFVFTTGGTGIGPRDITVDVVKQHIDKEIPGIMDMIRLTYGKEKPQALCSRSVAGLMGESLVFTLPGSVKAVNEYMDEILKSLLHLQNMIHGLDNH